MDIFEARRERLRQLLQRAKDRGETQSDFASKIGVSPSYMTRMLSEPAMAGHKVIGEDMALRIEAQMRLKPGSMLHPQESREEGLSDDEQDLLEAYRYLPSGERREVRDAVRERVERYVSIVQREFAKRGLDIQNALSSDRPHGSDELAGGMSGFGDLDEQRPPRAKRK